MTKRGPVGGPKETSCGGNLGSDGSFALQLGLVPLKSLLSEKQENDEIDKIRLPLRKTLNCTAGRPR